MQVSFYFHSNDKQMNTENRKRCHVQTNKVGSVILNLVRPMHGLILRNLKNVLFPLNYSTSSFSHTVGGTLQLNTVHCNQRTDMSSMH